MKMRCKVVGHELVKKGEIELVKIKLKGVDLSNLKVDFIVEQEERVKYPFGCSAVVDFSIQQEMPLDK